MISQGCKRNVLNSAHNVRPELKSIAPHVSSDRDEIVYQF